jgi:predicted site-specific integrase-resolvase
MKNTYKPAEFGSLINRTTKTLQKWDREGKLIAYRTANNRRYYIHDQYLEYMGLKANPDKKIIVYYRVSSHNQKKD